jgi:tripartite-type tricarboxylate transporter receptor subunit TctC
MKTKLKLISALVIAFTFNLVQAQSSYPSQAIKLVVPFTAGSTSDVTARIVAQKISGPLGQPVVVENRPGAGGGIGMQAVAKSKPDGYTLVVGSVSSTVVPLILSKNQMFNLFKEFVPVSTIANTPLVLTVVQESPINSVAELVAAAKKAPKTLTYGNSAGLYRLAMEALNQQAGIDLLDIPFKGPSDAATELLGGRLSVNPDSLGSAGKMLQAGRMRALAVLGSKRTEALPKVPTMAELGYKDFEFNGWIGILAPTGTPQAIVQRLHQEIAKAIDSEEIRTLFRNQGVDAVALSPHAYREAMAKDLVKYERIANAAQIEKQ